MDSMDEAELRERTRRLPADIDPDAEGVSRIDFRGARFDCGLAWVSLSEELGGVSPEAFETASNCCLGVSTRAGESTPEH